MTADNDLSAHSSWTSAAELYQDSIGKCTVHGTRRLVDILDDISPLADSSYVLDVGSGPGPIVTEVKRKHVDTRVLATDISKGMLSQIEKREMPNVSTQREDAVTLSGLNDNTFSHATTSFAIQFTSDATACVESMYRVLAPRGIAAIAIWGPKRDAQDAHNEACRRIDPEYEPAASTIGNAWEDETTHRNILKKVGFENVQTETIRMPLEPESVKDFCDYWFRGTNPVPGMLVGHWVSHGGSKEQLEREYEKILQEDYANATNFYMDAVLGWGRKPL